ncbi:MAG TPA: DUF4126 domain-containing protein [Terriglobales bacterium]|nr:DUF4126 domain-containing protein [Terriglobales bacterium]
MLNLSTNELAALLVATSFAAGLNVYATIATLGLLASFHLLPLPAQLHLLANWWTIAASAALFVIEFLADKVPVFDLIWNALHTFIRVPLAALLAYAATSQLSPGKQLLATLLGGVIALAAHGGKTAIRAAVTASPEPISNVGLSLSEDAIAIFLTWFASSHPYSAAAIVVLFLIAIVLFVGAVIRGLRALLQRAAHVLAS